MPIFFFSCQKTNQNSESKPLLPSNLSGKQLAQSYCATCHAFPEPNLLDKVHGKIMFYPKCMHA